MTAAIGDESEVGQAFQAGSARPDFGPDAIDAMCTVCPATWVALKVGEPCPACLDRHADLMMTPSSNGDHPELGDEPTDSWNIIDWAKLFARDDTETNWLHEPFLAVGRGHALVAPGGGGKSLLALWLAGQVATGHPGLNTHPTEPAPVLYIDYEMGADDLLERIEDMGFKPEHLVNLHYAQHPDINAMDTEDGGLQVALKAEAIGARLVIIDTYSRAVSGDENDADTTRAFYRHTALHLKRLGIAFLRIDHLGKDVTKGARGSSAKRDDVDIVWQLTVADDNTYILTATKRRMSWIPETVKLRRVDEPTLRYELADGETWPAGTKEVADLLDTLNVPLSASTRTAQKALKAAGQGKRRMLVTAAAKWRSAGVYRAFATPEPPREPPHLSTGGTGPGTTEAETSLNQVRNHSGNHREPLTSADGGGSPSLEGNHHPAPGFDDPPEDIEGLF